jgi:hypothetical protein
MPASASTVSKVAVNCPAPVPDEEFELVGSFVEVREQVAGLLGGPRPVWVGGDAEDVDVVAGDVEDEDDVQAFEGERAVHVEEVAGERGRRLGG